MPWRRCRALLTITLVLCCVLPALALDQTHRTLPSSSASQSVWQTYLTGELADRFADMFHPFIVSGCLHSTSGTAVSSAIACTAYGPSGAWVPQSAAAIDYTAAGATAADTCWVALDYATTGNVSSFVRVAGTHYVVDCSSSATPSPPATGQLIMQVTLAANAITAVQDLRASNPYGESILNVKDTLWGCKGDNSTDDTACFAAIAKRVQSTSLGATVIIPDGIYLVGTTANFGTTVGVRFVGNSYPWVTTTTRNRTLIKWTGSSGSPIWWFQQGSYGNTFERLAFSGADEAIRFRRSGGSLDILKRMKITGCSFDGQAIASLMIGYALSDTTSDDDMDGYTIEDSYFGTSADVGIIANVADNGYRLTIRDSVFETVSTAIKTQGFHDVKIVDNNIIPQTKGAYVIRVFSGNGFLTITGLYTERGRVLLNDAWGSWSSTRGIHLEDIVVNSNDSLVDAASPAIAVAFHTTFVNVNVSTGAIARHIQTTANGCTVIGTGLTTTTDVYDGTDGCLFLGFGVSGTGMVKAVQSSGGKGVQVLRRSDGSPTGEIYSVRRNDDASTVASINADGQIDTRRFVSSDLGFVPGCVAFASLPSYTTAALICCSDCAPATTIGTNCIAGAGPSAALKVGANWKCFQ